MVERNDDAKEDPSLKLPKRSRMTLWLRPDVRAAAERRAMSQRRSLTGHIEMCLAEDLQRSGHLVRADAAERKPEPRSR
jgi:hypothetical protein